MNSESSRIQSRYSKIKEKLRKKIPFTIATRKIKYQRKNLTKEAKDVYSKTTQYWSKKLRETQTNGSIYHVQGLEESTSLKCPF